MIRIIKPAARHPHSVETKEQCTKQLLRHFTLYPGWCYWRRRQQSTSVIRVHLLRTMNICFYFHYKPVKIFSLIFWIEPQCDVHMLKCILTGSQSDISMRWWTCKWKSKAFPFRTLCSALFFVFTSPSQQSSNYMSLPRVTNQCRSSAASDMKICTEKVTPLCNIVQ